MKHEKPELSRKNPYCLPKYRYLELKNFCFQYTDWKRALARLDGWRAQEGDKYIIKGFEEMMDSIEKGFNETMNVSYPEVERNELELITEYYMGVR